MPFNCFHSFSLVKSMDSQASSPALPYYPPDQFDAQTNHEDDVSKQVQAYTERVKADIARRKMANFFHKAEPSGIPPPELELDLDCPQKSYLARQQPEARCTSCARPSAVVGSAQLVPLAQSGESASPTACCVKTSITAETVLEPSGRAVAKVKVSATPDARSKTARPVATALEEPPRGQWRAPALQAPSCERRNGLEPDFKPISGLKKFEYLPCKPIGAEASKARPKCAGRQQMALSDNVSLGSVHSKPHFPPTCRANSESPIREQRSLLKSFPRERLIKYNACARKNNGLQDQCDAVVKRAMKECNKIRK